MRMTEDGRLAVSYNGTPAYDIIWEQNFEGIAAEIERIGLAGRRFCIVTDSNVAPFHLDALKKAIAPAALKVTEYVFPAGEASKNLDTVKGVYTHLIEEAYERKDCLIALGGGVVGDLTGYTAATYLRGIRFIQVPTTLLSMVDSSIGGKTGVDFDRYKNMVGAFHQPSLVYMNLNTLLTLSAREYLSGMGEIIKHGLIKDKDYYEWLSANREGILAREYRTLLTMIRESCDIKRGVVERDPKEAGERALLNFGHTLGHAVEKLKDLKLLHGECVAIGMAAASEISWRKGFLSKEDYEGIVRVIESFSLPVTVSGIDAQDVVETAGHDKKMEGGKWKFILLERIGNAIIDRTVTREDAKAAAMNVIR